MRKVFIDTNIIIDLVADRKPFSKYAIEIFQSAEAKKIKLYTSSHALATSHYLLKKYIDESSLRQILYNLIDFVSVIPIDTQILRKGLKSKHKDFEDSIQIYCASTIDKLDCLVTRNLKDFKNCEFSVLPPDEFVLFL